MSRCVRKPSKATIAWVVGVLTWLFVGRSRSDELAPVRVVLVWKAPAEGDCASGEQIRDEVDRLLQALAELQ